MELLYLTDISQIDFLETYHVEKLETVRPITGDIIVANRLEVLGIPFIDEWDYVSSINLDSNWDKANRLSSNWWQSLEIGPLEVEGIDIISCACQEFVWPFEAALNAKVAYTRIIKEFSVTKISGFFLPDLAVIRTGPYPAHRAVRSISQAVLFYLCDAAAIPIKKIPYEFSVSSGTLATKSRNNTNELKNSKVAPFYRNSAILILDGLTEAEYQIVRDCYNSSLDNNLVAISTKEIILGDDLDNNSDHDGVIDHFSNQTIEAVRRYNGPESEIFGNCHLIFQFRAVWEEVRKAIRLLSPFKALISIVNPNVVIFGHEAFTIEKALVKLCNNFKLPTLSLYHGSLGPKFSFRGLIGDSEHIALWNHWDKEIFNEYSISLERLHVVGAVRYQNLYKKIYESPIEDYNPQVFVRQKWGLKPSTPIVLILTTAINAGFASPVADPRKHRLIWVEILNYVRRRNDLQFVIRAHPTYDYYELYRQFVEEGIPNLFFFENITFEESMLISNVSVLVNYFTTAALESHIYRVPVVEMRNAVYDNSAWKDNIPDFACFEVMDVQNLEVVVDKIIAKKDKWDFSGKIREVIGFDALDSRSKLIELIKTIRGTRFDEKEELCHVLNETFINNLNSSSGSLSFLNSLFGLSYYYGSIGLGMRSLREKATSLALANEMSLTEYHLELMIVTYVNASRLNSITHDRSSVISIIKYILLRPKMFTIFTMIEKRKFLEFIIINLFPLRMVKFSKSILKRY